jgi:serine/threonine protein kinase
MPETCRELRTSLQIEQCRLLDWAQVAGLIDLEDDDDWPDVIKPHKTALTAMLAQIRTILDQFAGLNGKYGELRPDPTQDQSQVSGDTDLQAEYSSLRVTWSKKVKEREYMRGTNHLIKGGIYMGGKIKAGGKNIKNVVSHPKRLVWAFFDEDIFKGLLVRLAGYNNYLTELMHGQHLRQLEEATRKTQLEMVLVRSSLNDLKFLTAAIKLQLGHEGSQPAIQVSSVSARANELWQKLVVLKKINVENEKPKGEESAEYKDAIGETRIQGKIEYKETEAPVDEKSPRSRVTGLWTRPSGDKVQIWIEWKSYKTEIDFKTRIASALQGNVSRVQELVALLQSYKEDKVEFRIPVCLGYFDDAVESAEGQGKYRFGLVFAKHNQEPNDDVPRSLLNVIITRKCPSLSQRVKMAHGIATYVLYMHAARWLHKGIRSDNIIFSSLDPECREPYLSGFEYARPDRDGAQSTGGGPSPHNEAYVHPNYQASNAKGTYKKTYDIYSLGIVLLELAYWQPIQALMGFPDKAPRAGEVKLFRDRLLAPNSEYVEDLGANVGDKFQHAIMTCIEGEKALGVEEYNLHGIEGDKLSDVGDGADKKNQAEFEDKRRLEIEASVKLQRSFMKEVVDNLGTATL